MSDIPISPAVPYAAWPENRNDHIVLASHTFGRDLIQYARNYAVAKLPADLAGDARAAAEKAVFDALYGVMMILEGIVGGPLDDEHQVRYTLLAHVENRYVKAPLTTIELAPNGEGLCMGIHGWFKGDFGQEPTAADRAVAVTKASAAHRATLAEKSPKTQRSPIAFVPIAASHVPRIARHADTAGNQ